jgi:hypothetical protein
LGASDRLLDETGGQWDPVEARVRARTVTDIVEAIGRAGLEDGLVAGRGLAEAAVVDLAIAGET